MARYVGLDPAKDIHWVTDRSVEPSELFAEGQDRRLFGLSARTSGTARPAYRPGNRQQCRSTGLGRSITAACWPAPANTSSKYPVATKRGAARRPQSLPTSASRSRPRCATAGRWRAYTPRYDYALQTLSEIPYDKWREYDAEDTVRFYALRLHEAGMVKSTPQKIIADGTDWRFFDELKRELKA